MAKATIKPTPLTTADLEGAELHMGYLPGRTKPALYLYREGEEVYVLAYFMHRAAMETYAVYITGINKPDAATPTT